MTVIRSSLGLAALMVVSTLLGADSTTRRRLPTPVVSPQVHADRTVTFRLRAPGAGEVILNGQWPGGRVVMEENDGTWSATTEPIKPGVWEYSYSLDGVRMIDPANPVIKPMYRPRTSILHIPGKPPLLHDFQDVPHGTIRLHTYHSKSLNRARELVVYTPPAYDQRRRRTYPTLYLQHGMGDNHATWTAHGKAHWILDNLIAQKQAKPMIVVMMDGHAAGFEPSAFGQNTAAFEQDLFQDVMPFIEANYRAKVDAANRAIVGLSMGGGQSLTIGLNHLDTFGWVGGFSSATPSLDRVAQALDSPDTTARKLKLLWIACGRDDFLLERNKAFVAALEEKGIPHEWVLTEGNHSWPIWRGYLADFAPLLFR